MIKPLQSITLTNDNGEDTTYVVATAPAIVETTDPASVASFSDGAEGIPVTSLIADINPVQSGSGDPSPSNVRPITGWTGMNVVRNGFNQWDEEWEVGSINPSTGAPATSANDIRSKNFIPVLPNTQYYIKIPGTVIVDIYDKDKNFLTYVRYGTGNAVFNTTKNGMDGYYIKFGTYNGSYETTYNHDISINYPATDTDYHAYNGTTYPISWQTEAGTVYGGTLDVTTGLLTVDRAKVTLNGTQTASILNWRATATSVGAVFPWSLTNNKVLTADTVVPNVHSNYLKTVTYAEAFNGTYDSAVTTLASALGSSAYGICIRIPDTSVTTQILLNAYLSSNPLDVVYELATPQTYQLTPQAVTTVLGTNNIWADTGDVEVDYCADTKMYIDKVIAAL